MALGYLISPVIQIEDINGKPLVGGFVRVYVHGTTIPYITHKNFDGDLNPAEVVLDNKGMCVLLAESENLYDVYCEDRNRVEQWSRVNVGVCGGGSGGGSSSSISTIYSSDNSLTIIRTGSTVDIKINRDGQASALCALSAVRSSDGQFEFVGTPVNSVGEDIKVYGNNIIAKRKWYHYDATVQLSWNGNAKNATQDIAITGPANSEHVSFDLSYAHNESLDLSGVHEIQTDDSAFSFAVQGMPEGMTAQVTNASIHAIEMGAGGSGKADKVEGATEGNLAALDSEGNLTDSGIDPSTLATQTDITNINQVPASNTSDANKVLTVDSNGDPVWAPAQGGGGSDDRYADFPYAPGYMHTGWNKMVVRFGDTTYDPTTKTSAAYFTSITPLSEPGVYEFALDYTKTCSSPFANEWNDITNNPVDVLQLTSSSVEFGVHYAQMFRDCTGLRSIWNMRGKFGNLRMMCDECINLEIVSGYIPERMTHRGLVEDYQDVFIYIYDAYCAFQMSALFTKFKRFDSILVSKPNISSVPLSSCTIGKLCYGCNKLEVGPGIFGRFADTHFAFNGCDHMERLYGQSDLGIILDLSYLVPRYEETPAVTCDASGMFEHCQSFTDLNGTLLDFGFLGDISEMFCKCWNFKDVPPLSVAPGCPADIAFAGMHYITNPPKLDYSRITSAKYMFNQCYSLVSVSELLPLATSCTDVSNMLQNDYTVSEGALDLYNALSGNGSAVTTHTDTFQNTGVNGWNDVRSQIPSSWGGTGA